MKNIISNKYFICRMFIMSLLISIFFLFILPLESISMELEIDNKKLKYADNEPIFVTAIVKNNTTATINMPLLFFCEKHYIKFIIKNEDGNVARFIGPELDWGNSCLDILRMIPSSKFSQDLNLKGYYDLPPGKYSAIAIYKIEKGRRKEKQTWIGQLESNTVSFEIVRTELTGQN